MHNPLPHREQQIPRPLDRVWLAARHEGERPRRRSANATRNRCIDRRHSRVPRRLVRRPRARDIHCRAVHEQRPGRAA